LGKSRGSYEHGHSGVLNISWSDVARLCRHLVEKIEESFHPDVVVGITKGGVIPGAIIASMLGRDFYPVHVTRREQDVVTRHKPALLAKIPVDVVKDRRVVVVDDIVVSGDTLRVAVDECWAQGAAEVRTAALFLHSTSHRPDWFGLETDDLIIQPWNALVYSQGRWSLSEEYRTKLEEMGVSTDDAVTAVLLETT